MKNFFANKRIIIPALILLELVLLVGNALRFNRNESYTYTQDDLLIAHRGEETGELKHESGFYADHTNIPGSYVVTPPVFLNKGVYSVSIDYQTNAQGDWHTCYSTLDPIKDISPKKTADLVYSDHTAISASEANTTTLSWVRYGTTFDVRIGPETDATGDNIYVLVNGVTITYMRGKTIMHETTKLFALLLLINLLLYLGVLKREETKNFLKGKELAVSVILFTIMFSSYPLLNRGVYFGDDLFYHLRRIAFLGEGLKSGQFPVHILPGWDNGYGYAAGVGYGDFFLYPSAILVNLGFSLNFAYKFYVFLINVITVFVAYFAFKKISGNDKVGLASMVIYSLIGFRIHSIYTGATIGEYGAFTFLPLVVLGLWDIYTKKEKNAYLELAIGVTLCISCHVLTPYIMALFIPVFCILMIEKTLQKDILVPLAKALFAIVLLNLHFVLPLADYMLFQGMRGNTVTKTMWKRGQELVDLFTLIPDKYHDTAGFFGLGVVSLIILGVALAFVLCGRFKEKTWSYFRLLALTVLFILLSVNSIFYFFLDDKLPKVYDMFSTFQFPWRLLNLACVMIVFWFAVTMGKLFEDNDKNLAGMIALAAICVVCVVQSEIYIGEAVRNGKVITTYDSDYLKSDFYIEFSIEGIDETMTYDIQDMEIEGESEATAEITKRKGTTIYAHVENPTDNLVVAKAPLWGFRHYAAKGSGKWLHAYEAEDKRLAVDIPAGYSGDIKIWFREPWYWRVSELISLVATIWVVREIYNSKKKDC
ncbi:MAG: hypothetical protein IKZ97_01050 [Butyrivibrio sp.]|nr:hypothetical protein [Butyrivibrio sp.]